MQFWLSSHVLGVEQTNCCFTWLRRGSVETWRVREGFGCPRSARQLQSCNWQGSAVNLHGCGYELVVWHAEVSMGEHVVVMCVCVCKYDTVSMGAALHLAIENQDNLQ